jgi:hypothetical protein
VAVFGQDTQDLFAPVPRQHVREKAPIADDDAERAHELLRGRKALM